MPNKLLLLILTVPIIGNAASLKIMCAKPTRKACTKYCYQNFKDLRADINRRCFPLISDNPSNTQTCLHLKKTNKQSCRFICKLCQGRR